VSRVLHLYAGNLYGGIESYLTGLARQRHLTPRAEPHFGVCFRGRLWDELTAAGVPVHDLGAVRFGRPWTVLAARRKLNALFGGMKFAAAVTHSCWPHAVFAPVVRRAGVRLVHAVHDVLTGRHWLDRWAARTPPDLVVANSRFTAGPAAKLFPRSPVEVSYLPVPPSRVADRPATRAAVRAALGTPDSAAVVLQASRLERWKGQAVHLEALAKLKDAPGWEAWFAGGPQKPGEAEYEAELRAFAEKSGTTSRVKFLGQRADVPELMAAADVYCQPNAGPEPFGVSFVEAMYAGLPVVASAAGGPAETVTPACGFLCPAGDAAAVAEALGRLISDAALRAELSAAAPARAAELCDPARQSGRLADLILGTPEHVRDR
jgi:glycosyltransferase involved in cell wall biosynthesis